MDAQRRIGTAPSPRSGRSAAEQPQGGLTAAGRCGRRPTKMCDSLRSATAPIGGPARDPPTQQKRLPRGADALMLRRFRNPARDLRKLRHGLPRRRPLPREALRDHRGDAEGARPQGERPAGDLAVGRRARFRHARQRQGGGDRRHPPRRDQVSAGARHPALARGDRGQVQARERARLQGLRHDRQHRRQAGALQRLPLHAEPRRRGDHSGALLGQLSGDGGDQLRHARLRRDDAREQLQAAARGPRARDHPAHQVGGAQLALQPVGRRLHARRIEGADRSAAAPSAGLRADRRHVRASRLRRLRLHHARPRSSRRSTSAR